MAEQGDSRFLYSEEQNVSEFPCHYRGYYPGSHALHRFLYHVRNRGRSMTYPSFQLSPEVPPDVVT